MITELFIAIAFGFVAVVAWHGAVHSKFKVLRLVLALAVLWMAGAEIFKAVDLAVTSTSDIVPVRKVGAWPILAAIIACWFAPKWLRPQPKEA